MTIHEVMAALDRGKSVGCRRLSEVMESGRQVEFWSWGELFQVN